MRKTAPKAYEEVSIKADNQRSTAICKTSHRRLLSLRSTGTAAYYTIDSRLWQNIVDSQTPRLIFRWVWLSLQRFQGANGTMVLKHERKLLPFALCKILYHVKNRVKSGIYPLTPMSD